VQQQQQQQQQKVCCGVCTAMHCPVFVAGLQLHRLHCGRSKVRPAPVCTCGWVVRGLASASTCKQTSAVYAVLYVDICGRTAMVCVAGLIASSGLTPLTYLAHVGALEHKHGSRTCSRTTAAISVLCTHSRMRWGHAASWWQLNACAQLIVYLWLRAWKCYLPLLRPTSTCVVSDVCPMRA
jgi:hypothetical protein